MFLKLIMSADAFVVRGKVAVQNVLKRAVSPSIYAHWVNEKIILET